MVVDDDPTGGSATATPDGSGPSTGSGVTNLTRPGESVYAVSVGGHDARVTVTVTVAEPSDGRTVGIRYETGTETFETTVAGTDAVGDELAATPVAPFVSLVGFPSVAAVANIEELPVGRQLPVPDVGEPTSVEVTEAAVDSNVECYRTTWRYDGTVRYEDRIDGATRFKTHVTYSTADGDPFVRIELVETTVAGVR